MDVEQRFLSLLERVSGWRATDSGIALVGIGGKALLSLRRSEGRHRQ